MSHRLWPGYQWRFLAHTRTAKGQKGTYTGARVVLDSEDHPLVQFDELVIDHWFHLEQMDTRHWWMSVGGWHINVSIDAAGRPKVTIEQVETPDEVEAQCATSRDHLAMDNGRDDPPLHTHLGRCADCREFAAEVRRQRTDMAVLLHVEPSADLKRKAMEKR